jgi:hypothetical protein
MGTSDINSTPPATITSYAPAAISPTPKTRIGYVFSVQTETKMVTARKYFTACQKGYAVFLVLGTYSLYLNRTLVTEYVKR